MPKINVWLVRWPAVIDGLLHVISDMHVKFSDKLGDPFYFKTLQASTFYTGYTLPPAGWWFVGG